MDNYKRQYSTFRIYRLQISKVTILRNLRYLYGKSFICVNTQTIPFSSVYANLILDKMRDRKNQKCHALLTFPNLLLIFMVFLVLLAKERDFLPVHKTRPVLTYNFPLHGLLRRSVCKILYESNEGKQRLSLQFLFNVSGTLNKRLRAVERFIECLI